MHTEGCAFPSLFPCISYGTGSFETIAGCLFERRRSAVVLKTFIIESNIFLDQCYELLCFILHNVADLRHGWITLAFPPARKNVETRHKKWHKWETHQSVNPYGMAQITTWSIENTHLDQLLYPCLSKWNHALFNFYFLDFCHSCVLIQYRYKCNHPLNLPEQLSYTYTED